MLCPEKVKEGKNFKDYFLLPYPGNNLSSNHHSFPLLIANPEKGFYSRTDQTCQCYLMERSVFPSLYKPTHPHQSHYPTHPKHKEHCYLEGKVRLAAHHSVPHITFPCEYVNVLRSTGLAMLQFAGTHDIIAKPKMIFLTFITHYSNIFEIQKEVLGECGLKKISVIIAFSVGS